MVSENLFLIFASRVQYSVSEIILSKTNCSITSCATQGSLKDQYCSAKKCLSDRIAPKELPTLDRGKTTRRNISL